MKKIVFCLSLALICCSSFVWGGDYVIGDGDGLSIAVWGVPELSAGVAVRPDGKITLPAAGDIVASGFTPKQLSEELTNILGAYVKAPIVTVTVSGINNNKLYISGGGVPPQVRNMPERTTLFKLLCSLNGIENVDLERATILRGGKTQEVDFNALFTNGDLSKDVELQAEDILFLPSNELNKIYVVGAVNSPNSIMYRDTLRILDAILECGGFNKFAKQSSVIILRKKENERVRLKVNVEDLLEDGDLSQNIPLNRGDYIIVKEGIF